MTTNTEPRRPLGRRVFLGTVVAALTLGGLGYGYWVAGAAERRISVEEALSQAASGALVLVDIRRPDEWARTGVPQHGVPIDMRRPDFAEAVAEAAGDKPVALICARGVRSRRSVATLLEAGVKDVMDVPEGMLGSGAGAGWLRKGLPTVPAPT